MMIGVPAGAIVVAAALVAFYGPNRPHAKLLTEIATRWDAEGIAAALHGWLARRVVRGKASHT